MTLLLLTLEYKCSLIRQLNGGDGSQRPKRVYHRICKVWEGKFVPTVYTTVLSVCAPSACFPQGGFNFTRLVLINSKRSLCKTTTLRFQTKLLFEGNKRRKFNTLNRVFYGKETAWWQLLQSLQNYESHPKNCPPMVLLILTLHTGVPASVQWYHFSTSSLPHYHEHRVCTKLEHKTLHCKLAWVVPRTATCMYISL